MTASEHVDLLVVGASAAGLKCAARFRRSSPNARVVVLDAAREISVGACGLPYVVSGDIDDADSLRTTAFGAMRDEAFFEAYKGIEVLTSVRAETLDADRRRLFATRVDGGEPMAISYGDLVLATGAVPIVPPALGPLSERVCTVKTMQDARVLRAALQAGRVESAAIIGAGFIGCEMAEAFGSLWGCSVTLLEAAPHVLPGLLDTEVATLVERHLRDQGVDVVTGARVGRLEQSARCSVHIEERASVEADLVVVAIGVTPEVRLARAAGLAIGVSGGIVVDEHMRTSREHVYAAGDCVECRSVVDGASRMAPLGSLANRQGRVVADAVAGVDARFGPIAGSMVVKVFDLNVAATGLTRRAAKASGLDVRVVWGTFGDIAHYYPGEEKLFGQMVFERGTGRLVGLQLASKGEVVGRVDVFSNLLLRGGSVRDLLELEFAYAPPFASALDPLHHLGAMALAWEQDGVAPLGPRDSLADALVLDIRLDVERAAAPLEGAQSLALPMADLRAKLAEIPAGDVVVLCEKGPRSLEAARLLAASGRGGVRYQGGGRSFRDADLG